MAKYYWVPYFVFDRGDGVPSKTQKEAWKDYGNIVHDPDIEWAQGLDPFIESGIGRTDIER